MAHNLPSHAKVKSGDRAILKRPELAALLGLIASESSALESEIMYSYALLMGVFMPKKEKASLKEGMIDMPQTHPVAAQVFDTLENLPNRLRLLEKLAGWVLPENGPLIKQLDPLIRMIKKTSRRRAAFVHAVWGIADEYPDALILVPAFGNFRAYKASDFNEAIDLIVGTKDAVTEFNIEVIALLRKSRF